MKGGKNNFQSKESLLLCLWHIWAWFVHPWVCSIWHHYKWIWWFRAEADWQEPLRSAEVVPLLLWWQSSSFPVAQSGFLIMNCSSWARNPDSSSPYLASLFFSSAASVIQPYVLRSKIQSLLNHDWIYFRQREFRVTNQSSFRDIAQILLSKWVSCAVNSRRCCVYQGSDFGGGAGGGRMLNPRTLSELSPKVMLQVGVNQHDSVFNPFKNSFCEEKKLCENFSRITYALMPLVCLFVFFLCLFLRKKRTGQGFFCLCFEWGRDPLRDT